MSWVEEQYVTKKEALLWTFGGIVLGSVATYVAPKLLEKYKDHPVLQKIQSRIPMGREQIDRRIEELEKRISELYGNESTSH